MNTATHYYMRGMGQTGGQQQQQQQTQTQINVQQMAQGASSAAIQMINGNYVSGAGTALLTAAMIPSPATPFLAIAGAAAEILGAIGIGKGCGQTCILASQYANKAEPILQQNLDTYMAQPTPRSQSAQTAALNIFDQVWQGLVSACSSPTLGDAGKRCVTDRQAGACVWKAKAPQYPGQPAAGACWNWFNGYRDPIANDTNVVADSSTSTFLGTGTNGTGTILLIGAAVLGVVLLVGLS